MNARVLTLFQKLSGPLAVICVVLMTFAARQHSSAFQKCIGNGNYGSPSEAMGTGATTASAPLGERWPLNFECTGHFIDENNNAINPLATIIIAIFTIVLAKTSNRQASLTKDALVADKRAFIYASSINPLWMLDEKTGEYTWRLRAVWKNSGDTPSKNLRLYVDGELRNTPLPETFDFTRTTAPPGTGLMPPKSEYPGGVAPHPNAAPLYPQDIVDIQEGRKFFYLWGWVLYNDIFPETPLHITRFCWSVTPAGNPRAYSPGIEATDPTCLRFNYLYYTAGNCADNECSR